jgi:hypothetical protein
MSKTPPVEALIKLKRMQSIIKETRQLDFEFIKLGAECATIYGIRGNYKLVKEREK